MGYFRVNNTIPSNIETLFSAVGNIVSTSSYVHAGRKIIVCKSKIPKGKFYFEYKVLSGSTSFIGISIDTNTSFSCHVKGNILWYYDRSGVIYPSLYGNLSGDTYGIGSKSVLGVLIDTENRKIAFKNSNGIGKYLLFNDYGIKDTDEIYIIFSSYYSEKGEFVFDPRLMSLDVPDGYKPLVDPSNFIKKSNIIYSISEKYYDIHDKKFIPYKIDVSTPSYIDDGIDVDNLTKIMTIDNEQFIPISKFNRFKIYSIRE